MRAKSLLVALAVLVAWSSDSARADDEGKLTEWLQEMMDGFARIRPKPEGFVEPPDPDSSSTKWCRLEGTVQVGGEPLAGSLVLLLWVSNGVTVTSRVEPVITGTDGSFVFPRVPLGEYRVVGAAEGEDWEYPPRIVLPSPGTRMLDVSFGARKLVVTVLDQDLNPVGGAVVGRDTDKGASFPFVRPGTTGPDGKVTINFLAEGLNRLRGQVGDVTGYIRVYGMSEVEGVRMILPPFGSVEVLVKGWRPNESNGSMTLTCTRDGIPATLRARIDESGRAVLRCAPGRWRFSLSVWGRGVETPSIRTVDVRAGQTTSVEVQAKNSTETSVK